MQSIGSTPSSVEKIIDWEEEGFTLATHAFIIRLRYKRSKIDLVIQESFSLFLVRFEL